MQFNGKTLFLLKQMLVYADIKELTITRPAGYRPNSLGYIVRILAMAKIILLSFN